MARTPTGTVHSVATVLAAAKTVSAITNAAEADAQHGDTHLKAPMPGRVVAWVAKVGEHVEVNQDDARAGQTGNHVRYILAIGVGLVVIGFIVLGGMWFG